ncbi:MAG: OmpH family outer membrane protein [Puniceicoccales bacterium]|jgi:outer membrane protein|nr:OmpH family outer membrane protein [Puniceicoccales bacterium]
MKKLLSILCALALSCGVAQAQKAPKVATVDISVVATKYQKAQALEQLLKNDVERFRKDAQNDEQQLRSLADAAQKARADMQNSALNEQGRKNAEKAFNERAAAFDQRRQEFANKQRAAETTLQQRARNNQEQIITDIRGVCEKVAKERAIDLVLPSGAALFADRSLDISEEVVKRLNAENPTPVVPATPAAPAGGAVTPATGGAPAASGPELAPLPTAPAPAASR